MARVKPAGKTKTATGKPRARKSAVKRPAPKPPRSTKPKRQRKPGKCWERTGKAGQKYVVCDTSKGQKGVYKPKKK